MIKGMPMYASVIIDISAKEIDKTFEYSVPEHLRSALKPGMSVVVPFGKTTKIGYIASLTVVPEYDKHADIASILDETRLFDDIGSELAEWAAEKYICSISDCIRLMLPPGRSRRSTKNIISKPTVNIKTELYARLSAGGKHMAATGDFSIPGAPKQAAALQALAAGPMPVHQLKSDFEVSIGSLRSLETKGLAELYREEAFREPEFTYPEELRLDLKLTAEQAVALDEINTALTGTPRVFLLQGVTGSGKTEVYLRAIAETLKKGRSGLVLVPEIALTPQTAARFRTWFGDRVAVVHSGLGLGERYDQWRGIHEGRFDVVVGARSAVWAPLRDIGLIVVDEEHEPSYKQDRSPRYHARDVAMERARLAGATVILGSATPSMESRYRADKGAYRLLRLTSRIENRPMPEVEIVDMKTAEREGDSGYLSRTLAAGLRAALDQGDKAILFLNRRGFANFIICRDCGNVIQCERCNVSLTYHSAGKVMVCHHCGFTAPAPDKCPECGGSAIGFFGAGTERIEQEIRAMFPDTPVTRMDSDTTTGKDAHSRKLTGFKSQRGGILLGTQMIAKGLDFPDVTLVGIVNADTALNIPDFRAGERTFQLMMQVAGRAGRGARPGKVIVQTYNPDNYAVQAMKVGDFDSFYETEITLRDALDYPPFCELINIGFTSTDEERVAETAERAAEILRRARDAGELPGIKELLGPAPAPLSKVKHKFRWHMVLKTDGSAPVRDFLRRNYGKMSASKPADKDAMVYDVDPMSLL